MSEALGWTGSPTAHYATFNGVSCEVLKEHRDDSLDEWKVTVKGGNGISAFRYTTNTAPLARALRHAERVATALRALHEPEATIVININGHPMTHEAVQSAVADALARYSAEGHTIPGASR